MATRPAPTLPGGAAGKHASHGVMAALAPSARCLRHLFGARGATSRPPQCSRRSTATPGRAGPPCVCASQQVLGARGNNLHEVEWPDGTRALASMPTKFRMTVWIKRGACRPHALAFAFALRRCLRSAQAAGGRGTHTPHIPRRPHHGKHVRGPASPCGVRSACGRRVVGLCARRGARWPASSSSLS